MKKNLIALVMAGLLGSSVSAFAAAPEFEGSLTLRHTGESGAGSDFDYRLGLQMTQEIMRNLTFTGKLVFYNEEMFPTSNRDRKYGEIDKLSLNYVFPNGKSSLLVGKDDLRFGNGLLADDTVSQITFATTVGAVDIQLSGFEDKYMGVVDSDQDTAFGASVQTTFGKLGLGTSYIKQEDSYKNWAINATYPLGPVEIGAEYTKNTALPDNPSAYCITATYGQLEKRNDISYMIGYVRVEEESIGGYTLLDLTNAADFRGMICSVSYQLSSHSSVILEHNALDDLDGNSRTRTRIIFEQLF